MPKFLTYMEMVRDVQNLNVRFGFHVGIFTLNKTDRRIMKKDYFLL